MPFKANRDRRHHIPKQRHRVTNWATYDAGLRARGSLTVWWLLSGSGVVKGPSRDQGGDEGSEQGFAASARVVHELEEAEIERQLVLRDAAVRAQPGAQQRPEALDGVDVDLAEAVAVLVARILAAAVADRLVPVAPGRQAGVDVVLVGVDSGCRRRPLPVMTGLIVVCCTLASMRSTTWPPRWIRPRIGRLVLRQRAASRRACQPAPTPEPPLLATAAGWPLWPATT